MLLARQRDGRCARALWVTFPLPGESVEPAPDGKAVPGARVYFVENGIDSAMAQFRVGDAELLGFTGPDGVASIARQADGCLVAGAWPYAPSPHEPCVNAATAEPVRLELVAAAWIDGAASQAGWLIAESPDGARAATGRDGRFKLGPLSAGEHELLLVSSDGEPKGRATIELQSGETKTVSF